MQQQTKQSQTPKLAVRPRDAAQMLGVSERTLWQWSRDGLVPFKKVGRTILYSVADLVAFLGRPGGE